EARILEARRLEVITGFKGGGTRNNCTSFADRIDAAENDVIDLCRVDAVAVAQGFKNLRAQTDGWHFVQRTVLLATPARCAHVIVNISLSHFCSFPPNFGPPGPKARRNLWFRMYPLRAPSSNPHPTGCVRDGLHFPA